MNYLNVGVSPGNVPVFHGSKAILDRKLRFGELILRCLICGLAVVAAILIGTDTQVRVIFTIQKRARFTDMKALVFLVIANGIAAAYSFLQAVRCVVGMLKGSNSVSFSRCLALIIFSADQMIAYLSVAAVAAAMQSAMLAKSGQPELEWMKIGDMYAKFCNQVGEGIASALLASISMVFLSTLSAFSLFRLYGSNTTTKNVAAWYVGLHL